MIVTLTKMKFIKNTIEVNKMKLIVGLGNPGKEYENTRHNMGFMALDEYATQNHLTFNKEKFNGLYTDFSYNGDKVILLKPQSYINLSGEVIRKFVDYFKIELDDLLVISDDLDMDLGKIKIKYKGSSGGHNGLKNIESHLGTQNYRRIKIGISNNKNIDTKDYVLGKLNGDSKKIIEETIQLFPKIIDDYLKIPFDNLMNKYN